MNRCYLCALGPPDAAHKVEWRIDCTKAVPRHSVFSCNSHYATIVYAANQATGWSAVITRATEST